MNNIKDKFESINQIGTNICLIKICDPIDGSYYSKLILYDKNNKDNFIASCIINTLDLTIGSLYVTEAYRRKGYAKSLLKVAIEKFGIRKLSVLKDNAGAIDLYTNAGFTVYKKDNEFLYMKINKKVLRL